MSFFIQAHQDDWQVHMGANAYDDLTSGGKVVLVFITAGDAGKDSSWWTAREDGARASVEVGVKGGPGGDGAEWVSDTLSYNGHLIPRFAFGNAVCVFMRLPDGGDGSGFSRYGNQSLQRLRASNIAMKAVDRDDTYSCGEDMLKTLADIFGVESQVMPARVWYNAIAPGEFSGHSDHENTAFAVMDAANWAKGSLGDRGQSQSEAFFKGSGRPLPPNPPAPDSGASKRAALFKAYEDVMRQQFGEGGTTTAENPPLILSWIANQDPPELSDA